MQGTDGQRVRRTKLNLVTAVNKLDGLEQRIRDGDLYEGNCICMILSSVHGQKVRVTGKLHPGVLSYTNLYSI